MTLLEFLRHLDAVVPPCEAFPSGLLSEGSGEPTDATSPFFMFYSDTDTGDVYWNSDRTSTGWEIIVAGAQLDADEGRLKVTI